MGEREEGEGGREGGKGEVGEREEKGKEGEINDRGRERGRRERGSHEHTVRSNLAHMIGVIFFYQRQKRGENVAVSMIWTAIVEHTFRGNTCLLRQQT